MKYLTKHDVLEFQRELALETEGFFYAKEDNINNADALEFLIEAPKSSIFGKDMYPDIFLKAACYAYFIIGNHVFFDGNKRTGMKSAMLFLGINGYFLKADIGDDQIVELALNIAENKFNLKKIALFFKLNSEFYPNESIII